MGKWKKYLLYGIIGFLILGTLGSIFGEKQEIKTISIQDDILAMDIDKENTIKINIEPSDVKLVKSDFVVNDDSIIEIDSVKDNIVTLKSLKNEGTATLYCLKDDIKSNDITVKVVDQQKLALAKDNEQRKIEEAKKAAEAKEAADKKEAQDKKQTTAQKSTTSNKTTSSASSTKPTGEKVYITPTGKKYHAIAKCGNTKSSKLVSLSDAKSRGLEACKKCY